MDHKQFSRRVVGVVVMLALLLTFLCSNLYTIQYTNGAEYSEQSVSQVSETETVAASRGNILDRNGKVLVSNQVSYNVTLDLNLLGNEEKNRCDTILALTQTATEQGVTWTDTLPITTQPPFVYTTEDPFYTTSVNEEGETEYNLTSLGRQPEVDRRSLKAERLGQQHRGENRSDGQDQSLLRHGRQSGGNRGGRALPPAHSGGTAGQNVQEL